MTTFAEWKAQVENYDKLVTKLPEGISVEPLYVEAPQLPLPAKRGEGRGEGPIVDTVPLHELGADAVDELAYALTKGAELFDAGKSPVAVNIAIGRDTFVELAKLRALRIVWAKLATVAGAEPSLRIHAVSSQRTLTRRDPWVNMLRVTTQAFAAMLGGADEFTPAPFAGTPLAQRVAHNTLLVLEHESALGKVVDPAAGSYYFDTLTDALAREAWKRFQQFESDDARNARIAAAWQKQLVAIAKRKVPILGVSEFANLDEKLPNSAPLLASPRFAGGGNALPLPAERGEGWGEGPVAREAAQFEALRVRADAKNPQAILVTLGTLAESRARVGFAQNFLAAGGIRCREVSADEKATVAVICGTDERYATEAVAHAKSLKSLGCTRVLVAGRPGSNEAELRAAGVDGFIFIGVDLIETLSALLEVYA